MSGDTTPSGYTGQALFPECICFIQHPIHILQTKRDHDYIVGNVVQQPILQQAFCLIDISLYAHSA